MAKRIYRELSQEVKDKISRGMRKHHQNMGGRDLRCRNRNRDIPIDPKLGKDHGGSGKCD